jgi:hypothetical protein
MRSPRRQLVWNFPQFPHGPVQKTRSKLIVEQYDAFLDVVESRLEYPKFA